jgi:membrane fusion protein (multidrug efflux system)
MTLPDRLARLVAFACVAPALFACGEAPPAAQAPVDVVVAPVVQRDVAVTSEWIGTTEGSVDAQIRAQAAGYLVAREYKEGTLVKEGEVLFRIDPRVNQAALDQARGDLGRAQAMLGKAKLDVDRFTPLVAEGAVSRQELDNAIQLKRSAEASLLMAKAALEKAQIDLEFTEIRSPTDGIAGVARAQLGDLVGPSDPEPLTAVSKLDPIRVSFPISEREYLRFVEVFRGAVEGRASARDGGLELILADGSVWPHRGRGVPASAGVDPATGTLLVRGEFPNPDYVLRAGQYARVRAVTETKKQALLVPQRAISELQGVFQVAVVGADDKVELRVVEPGTRDGSLQVIEKGLSPGERVVVEGLQKVRAGSVVNPKSAEPAPPAGAGR